ncbi:peptide deformylase [Nesterenkonia alkaliphila]|uniref:Peptide deformylase n=1 Tax=Nesterenkonia alkaliphila TaxID=1463631 RepID=A0A7K1UL39_9MICC|nr:peptide deformylase [Nesterenkonia alkaliphila]MVT27146.1 peptide deformylase [Nesterenkonia alkaliphila]GFZ91214.1 peptide deformylase [Nesterenkonia alkaliphila]
MPVLEIRQIGDPVLRTPATEVPQIDERIRKLVQDMYETNENAGGIGIAAPQVGISLRIFTWDVEGSRGAVINPQLELAGEPGFVPRPRDEEPDAVLREGCLSVPGQIYGPAPRYPEATLTGLSPDGSPLHLAATGLLAACFQHELDHLDGKLFLDRLTGEHKKQAFRALRNGAAV